MSFQSDLQAALIARAADEANTNLTKQECLVRYLRRVLYAEHNNAGTSTGAFQQLSGIMSDPGAHMDDATWASTKATFEAALATLVADGAAPTSGHRDAATNAWQTYLAHLNVRHHNASNKATVQGDIATLLADASSPTQGHVNSLNSDYTTLKATVI